MEIWRRTAVAVLFGLVFHALLPMEAGAQGLTGSLVGTVRDQQGGVLPGAVIRVTSPALMAA